MKHIIDYIPVFQLILSFLLIFVIIIQQNDESLGESFGGGDSFDTVKRTRRGAEKKVFNATIIIAILFIISSIASFLVR